MHLRIQQFVREYLIDLNAAAAARRCGYPARCAVQRGSKLMARQDVQAAVRQAMEERAKRTEITADRVLKEYARIAFADPRKVTRWGPEGLTLLPSDQLSEDDAAAVAWVSTGGRKGTHAQRIRMQDKQRALDALARHLGLLKDGRATHDLRSPAERLAERQRLADSARAKLSAAIERLAQEKG